MAFFGSEMLNCLTLKMAKKQQKMANSYKNPYKPYNSLQNFVRRKIEKIAKNGQKTAFFRGKN